MENIKAAYKKKYKTDLEKDVVGDTSGDFQELLVELLKAGRDQGTSVDKKQAEKDAKALYKVYRNIVIQKEDKIYII